MNIFEIIGNLYTAKNCSWMAELEDNEIQPFLLNRWIAMNDNMRVQARWLTNFTFELPPKMWLSLAWSILPKFEKAPYVKYIKAVDATEEFNFILIKIRKQFEMSDNDYNNIKFMLLAAIKRDMKSWFAYYGVEKKYWKQYMISFDYIKTVNPVEVRKPKGLGAWT